MITMRELPAEEWPRLAGLPDLPPVMPQADQAVILVGEDGDQIVGYWMVMNTVHIEPGWLHPDYRRQGFMRRAWPRIQGILDRFRVPVAFCYATSPTVANYLSRLGMSPLDGTLFMYQPSKEISHD